jgi:hypothetical protein
MQVRKNYLLEKGLRVGHGRGKSPFRRKTMTIGIAALCTRQEGDKKYGVIIGAADRLITIGQGVISYEPPQQKIHMLTPLIVAIPAGDNDINMEVIKNTIEAISNKKSVYDIADLYSQKYEDYIKEAIERTILYPRGLTWDSYNNLKYDKDPSWFNNCKTNVFGYENPGSETIIAGVDESGPQIYLVNNGWVRCQNWAGFATVGIGGEHARLEFIIGNHSSSNPYADTLLLTYIAKQRASIAAQVGEDTDLFSISIKDGYVDLPEELKVVKKIYADMSSKQAKDKNIINKKVRGIIN